MGKTGKLATAYHNLSVTLGAGVSILRSFDIIAEGLRGNLRKVFAGVREAISKGSGVSESMKQYKRTFGALDLLLVEAAETSGKYPECFQLLSKWYEFKIKIVRLMGTGLILPLLILHLAILIAPLPTMAMGNMSFHQYLWRVLGTFLALYIIVTSVILLYKLFRKAGFLRYMIDSVMLMVPLLGKGLWELSISRFAYAFNMLYKSGVPIAETVPLATGVAGNLVVQKIFAGGAKSVKAGNTVCEGFSRKMPTEYRNLWQVGEETGELEKTVDKIAEISSDRAEFYFSEFARWFPRFVYFLVCIWMITQIFRGYTNLYNYEGLF